MNEKVTCKGYKPDSVDGFQCTMGACEDNCCRNTGWRITVDAVTYEKYKNLDTKLGEHIINCIEEKDGTYYFKEFDHGHCPLLASSGLCTIHRDLGAEYLCTTCTSYPRVWNSYAGQMEYWLSLSCPDVIRWVLYRKKRINYMSFPVNTETPPLPQTPFETEKQKVRDMLIKICHHRRFSLMDKMLYMGLFMRSLSKGNSIDEAITVYQTNMKNPKILDSLKENLGNVDPGYRREMFDILLPVVTASVNRPKKIPLGIKNVDYYNRIVEFHARMLAIPRYSDKILDAFDRIVVPYINSNSYMFENYMVYSLVSSRFMKDMENQEEFGKAYSGFAGEFISMLTFTSAIFIDNESLSHDEMIIGMYLFHRSISHNQSLREKVSGVFNDNLLNLLFGALSGVA